MNLGLWMIIFLLVGMVWAMLKFHVEPGIVLALLICVSLIVISIVFISHTAVDNERESWERPTESKQNLDDTL